MVMNAQLHEWKIQFVTVAVMTNKTGSSGFYEGMQDNILPMCS